MKKLYYVLMIILTSSGLFAQNTMFELLPSSHTHVTFNNEIKDTKEHNILIYSNYYGGAGVGVGDFNNDGLQDIFFAGNLVADELYVNKGNFEFENITRRAGIEDNGGWSSGVLVADVNQDGWQDIYVTRELYDDKPELRKNKLYINNGDLTFTESSEAYRVDHTGRTRSALFLDYDKDGWVDLFLLTQPPNPGNYSPLYGTDLSAYEYAPVLLRNTGKGYFENVSKKSGLDVPCFPNSASAADVNNDGWVDIYVSNDFQAPDMLYLNKGNGTFENVLNESTGHISYFSMGVDIADINNDGLLDIHVVDMSAEKNQRIKANMSGMDPKSFWKIVDQGGHYQYMYNTLQLNNGELGKAGISFSDIGQMAGVASTDWSWSNIIADFDNDGFKDIYVTNGILRDIRNTDSDKNFSKYVAKVAQEFVKNNPNAGEVSVWDILNLEEALDIIPSEPLANYMYQNKTGLRFEKKTNDWGLDHKSFSNGSAYADLNNDGALDLIVSNVNNEAYIFKNNVRKQGSNNYLRVALENTRHTLGSRVKITTGSKSQWYEFTSARGMYSGSEQVAHFGVASAGKVDTVTVNWSDGTQSVLVNVPVNQQVTVEKKQSQKQQIAKKHSTLLKEVEGVSLGLDFRHEENQFDDYAKQVLLPHKMSQFGPAMAVADVNGDGREDVFLGAAASRPAVLYIQQATGRFVKDENPLWVKEALYEDVDALFFDADSDGDQDLYVVSGGNKYAHGSRIYQDRLYVNDGTGRFEKNEAALPAMLESGACVRAADFDSDGDMDLFVGARHVPWQYPEPASSQLLLNDKGRFTDVTKKMAKDLIRLGMVTDAVWTDYDQDGLQDLLVVGEWMPITVIKNTGDKFYNATQEFGLSDQTGWWYSVEQGDIDRDGDLDYILGNLGLNYKYQATANEPFEVHYKDFDNSGQKDIVLSYYNFGKQYPLRGRSCSSQQIPAIAQKFQSYDLFASADLFDVYGVDELKDALHYQAKNFAHVQLVNEGKGKMTISPLTEETQVSSINDILLLDVDGDSFQEILAVGNNYPVEVETPRNDAGKGVFISQNAGKSHWIAPRFSGFYVDKDARKVAEIRVGEKKYILVAANNDNLSVFEIKDEKQ